MSNPMISEYNAETGEIIERPLNNDELSIFAFMEEEKRLLEISEQAKLTKKRELLAKLELTEDEAKLFFS